MNIEVLFGLRVRELRRKKALSQEQLGFRCGLSKNYISDLERGTRNVTIKVMEKLALGLECEIWQLLHF